MKDAKKYYENTKNALPHKNVKEFLKIENKQGKAIDIGCGAGRDTIFLIKNNWNVIAIDREDTKDIISSKLNDEELKRFRFIKQDFENIKLEKMIWLWQILVFHFVIKKILKIFGMQLWEVSQRMDIL